MRKLKVLSIDPSLRNFGLVSGYIDLNADVLEFKIEEMVLQQSDIDKSSAKVVRKNSDDLRRARLLCRKTKEMAEKVNIVFVEVPVGSQSARSMASYGICIGVLASISKPMIQVTPSEVKLAACGSKTASKQDMIDWAVENYPNAKWLTRNLKGKKVIVSKNEHLADAVAVAHAAMLTEQFEQAIGMLLT